MLVKMGFPELRNLHLLTEDPFNPDIINCKKTWLILPAETYRKINVCF
jgi:hypothetical protein